MFFVFRALKVCEFGLAVTDGSNVATVVPVADRLPLLQTWVKSKHCLQLHVGKTLGTADEVINMLCWLAAVFVIS